MKILVYGAGAVGGYLGARLARSRHEVTLVARQVTADAINTNGLFLTENGTTVHIELAAASSIAQAFDFKASGGPVYDLIVMAMKSYDVPTAVDHLVAFCPDPPPIVTVQNGIGAEAPVVRQFGAGRVIAGAVTTPISKEATNRLVVEQTDRGMGLAPTAASQEVTPWVTLFQQAGIETVAVPGYQSLKWSKAFLNIMANATSAILNRTPAAIYRVDALFGLELRMLREALAVMEALKIKLVDLPGAPATRLAFGVRRTPRLLLKPVLSQLVGRGRGDKMPSFHLDLAAGKRQNEVIYHNGAIARAGEKVGALTPVNAALTNVMLQLVRQEVDWRDFDGNAGRLLKEVARVEKQMKRRR